MSAIDNIRAVHELPRTNKHYGEVEIASAILELDERLKRVEERPAERPKSQMELEALHWARCGDPDCTRCEKYMALKRKRIEIVKGLHNSDSLPTCPACRVGQLGMTVNTTAPLYERYHVRCSNCQWLGPKRPNWNDAANAVRTTYSTSDLADIFYGISDGSLEAEVNVVIEGQEIVTFPPKR